MLPLLQQQWHQLDRQQEQQQQRQQRLLPLLLPLLHHPMQHKQLTGPLLKQQVQPLSAAENSSNRSCRCGAQ